MFDETTVSATTILQIVETTTASLLIGDQETTTTVSTVDPVGEKLDHISACLEFIVAFICVSIVVILCRYIYRFFNMFC